MLNTVRQPAPEATRYNFYAVIHKAIRLGHCRMLAALGSTDFTNAAKGAALLAELRAFLALGKSHLDGENREIHTALEQRAPGASAHAADDHDSHERSFAELEALIRAVEQAGPGAREHAARALYHRYALFAAHDLEHMHEEETALLGALHEAFTDAELHAIEGRIVAAYAPAKMAAAMALVMPAINHFERVEMIAKLQKAMPEPVFDTLLYDTIRPSLGAADYAAAIGALMLRSA